MNKKRLLELADYLDTVPPEMFEMRHWALDDEAAKRLGYCGAVACAFGHAAMLWPEYLAIRPQLGFSSEIYLIKSKHYFGFGAACKFFRISKKAAYYLFEFSRYSNRYSDECGPKTVAQRIRRYVQDGVVR